MPHPCTHIWECFLHAQALVRAHTFATHPLSFCTNMTEKSNLERNLPCRIQKRNFVWSFFQNDSWNYCLRCSAPSCKEICSNLVFCVNLGLLALSFCSEDKAKRVQLNGKTLQVLKISLPSCQLEICLAKLLKPRLYNLPYNPLGSPEIKIRQTGEYSLQRLLGIKMTCDLLLLIPYVYNQGGWLIL